MSQTRNQPRHARHAPRRRRGRVVVGVVAVLFTATFAKALVEHQGEHQPTPSTSTTTPPSTSTTSTTPLESNPLAASSIGADLEGDPTVTASVLDLKTGRTFTLHPSVTEATASIVKVDIMATLFSQERAGRIFSAPDQAALTPMIEVSSNGAATELWTAVGGASRILAYDRGLGMDATTPSPCLTCANFSWPGWGLTTTSASDQVLLLNALLVDPDGATESQRALAARLLENVVPSERWGVSSQVPSSVRVELKNGWVPLSDGLWQINSIGRITGNGRDYLIAILSSKNTSEASGIARVDRIGAAVYTALQPRSS